MTGAEWLAASLRTRGVDWIAALCGHGLDPLFDALKRAGVRIVDVRNEQTAGYMAEAHGRLTRRPGVCASSSGVAAVNALTGVCNAWFDGAPMLLLSGAANSDVLGRGCFQDMDAAELARPLTRYSKLVTHDLAECFDQAWAAACGPRPGPAHLMLPMDVQRADCTAPVNAPVGQPQPEEPDGAEVAAALAAAERPLIIAGSGAFYAGEADALMRFAERHSIPVMTPIWDRGVCDRASDAFLGVTGAFSGGPDLLSRADCVLLAGVESDYRIGYLGGGVRWRPVESARRWTAWLAEARALRDRHTAEVERVVASQAVDGRTHARDIMRAVAETLPEDATLIIDGGSVGQWAHQLLCSRRYPSYWLTCGRSGVVGYGLAAAMAAKLTDPRRPVVLLSGDGAFTFTVAEIECAVRQKLHFTAIVADDRKWGITHTGHMKQFGAGIATELGAIQFDMLARAMGAEGLRIERPELLAPALRQAIAAPAVTVLHAPISGGNPA